MLSYIVTAVVAFLAGYIFHTAITKYLKAAEVKAESAAKSVVTDADQVAKKI